MRISDSPSTTVPRLRFAADLRCGSRGQSLKSPLVCRASSINCSDSSCTVRTSSSLLALPKAADLRCGPSGSSEKFIAVHDKSSTIGIGPFWIKYIPI